MGRSVTGLKVVGGLVCGEPCDFAQGRFRVGIDVTLVCNESRDLTYFKSLMVL